MNDGSTNNRLTIGLLVPNIASEEGYDAAIWNGVVEACKQRDVNLICFVGGWLPSSLDGNEDPRNAVYDLVSKQNIDGLIVSGVVVGLAPPERVERFYDQYRPLPMVNIALAREDVPNVLPDNYRPSYSNSRPSPHCFHPRPRNESRGGTEVSSLYRCADRVRPAI